MPTKSTRSRGRKSAPSHRVGRVTVYVRGKVWYLYYAENGQRVRRRVGISLAEAKRLAAQVNAQLSIGAPAMLSFCPVSIPDLRQRWLDHHEHVLRSSLATIRRYRAATDHLVKFTQKTRPLSSADRLTSSVAEGFVRYLREAEVSPNGHPNTAKRSLRDKGVVFILETCRAMFNYAAKHRHLPPYHENPFSQIDLARIPIEDAKPVELFTPKQEEAFLEACDDWQFPIFLTLGLTGMRPGELVHLLLPDDADFKAMLIRVRNKPELGWRSKTRNQRDIPICEELRDVLRCFIDGQLAGPLFLRRRFSNGQESPVLGDYDRKRMAVELARRVEAGKADITGEWTRLKEARIARTVWRDAGAIKETVLRIQFLKVASKTGLEHMTCPKTFRHQFATSLQDAGVDPLIRQELMGHAPGPRNGGALGMTAVYTHTRTATRRSQFETAMATRAHVIEAARRWVHSR